ncbi:hypothetical protein [Blastochloris viridis]|uniref:DUF2946 domain-containing protein n=1 Tax=Blastochloris viridis TaxID=1079 RepID=A0A0H5BGJ4_BLAVI|nr:hypothetical protein [Blastochloris viridis]ALK09831.1 hypothetical protein BVIR_2061 [Blastochloris viridis]BAS00265.1 hypothetical protein BV133_2671 [Blastochloris viridis]CUU42494.1 hypothetical protein BVIRIDIS_15060 [Blastochloris viridis]
MMTRLSQHTGEWARRVVAIFAICGLLLPAAGFPHAQTPDETAGAIAFEFLICRGGDEAGRHASGDAPPDPALPAAGKCQACVLPVGALPAPIIAVPEVRAIAVPFQTWTATIAPAIAPQWPHRQPPPRAPPPAA